MQTNLSSPITPAMVKNLGNLVTVNPESIKNFQDHHQTMETILITQIKATFLSQPKDQNNDKQAARLQNAIDYIRHMVNLVHAYLASLKPNEWPKLVKDVNAVLKNSIRVENNRLGTENEIEVPIPDITEVMALCIAHLLSFGFCVTQKEVERIKELEANREGCEKSSDDGPDCQADLEQSALSTYVNYCQEIVTEDRSTWDETVDECNRRSIFIKMVELSMQTKPAIDYDFIVRKPDNYKNSVIIKALGDCFILTSPFVSQTLKKRIWSIMENTTSSGLSKNPVQPLPENNTIGSSVQSNSSPQKLNSSDDDGDTQSESNGLTSSTSNLQNNTIGSSVQSTSSPHKLNSSDDDGDTQSESNGSTSSTSNLQNNPIGSSVQSTSSPHKLNSPDDDGDTQSKSNGPTSSTSNLQNTIIGSSAQSNSSPQKLNSSDSSALIQRLKLFPIVVIILVLVMMMVFFAFKQSIEADPPVALPIPTKQTKRQKNLILRDMSAVNAKAMEEKMNDLVATTKA